MMKIRDYVKVQSLEEAYELNQKKSNRIIGGMLWLKMGNRNIQTAIDLSELGLDTIEENEEEFSIGCMVTLRQLEAHEGLAAYTDGAMRESVKDIVGVQFRNLATVGGDIFGRFGFSDVLTCFLALDTYVELYKGGRIPLEVFAENQADNDILVRLIVKKHPVKCVYLSQRNTRTDFPVLTCAVSADAWGIRAVIGARPARAVCIPIENKNQSPEEIAKLVAENVTTGSNMRASAEYRSHLVNVLVKRALVTLAEKGGLS